MKVLHYFLCCCQRMPQDGVLFPLGVNNILEVDILAQTAPSTLQAFTLREAFLLSVDRAPPHWMVLLIFTRVGGGENQYAFFAERVLANTLSSNPSFQSSQIIGHLSHPTRQQAVNDRVRGYLPPQNTPQLPIGHSQISKL